MNHAVVKCALVAISVLAFSVLGGCGGTKVLNEPRAIETTQPLATIADERLQATLDWVIVRDGPGSWARNADWDEYLLRVKNISEHPILITRLRIIDSLDTAIEPQRSRRKLVKGSKRSARRYKDSGLEVKAGRGAGTMLIAGAAVTAVGVGAASAVAYGSLASGAAAGAGSAGAAVGGLLLLGPALAVGGVVRGIHNSAVNTLIEDRQTPFPLQLAAGEERSIDVFYPLAPSPRSAEFTYTGNDGEHVLAIDTRAALDGLHLDAAP